MNNAVLIGRITKDPELRYIPGDKNTAVVKFTLAVDRNLSREKRQEAESKNQPTADFIQVVVWGKQAENVSNYTGKGSLVGVQGSIQTGSYQAKDGTRRYTTEVNAIRVQFLDSKTTNDGYGKTNQYNQNNQESQEQDLENIEGFYAIDDTDIPF